MEITENIRKKFNFSSTTDTENLKIDLCNPGIDGSVKYVTKRRKMTDRAVSCCCGSRRACCLQSWRVSAWDWCWRSWCCPDTTGPGRSVLSRWGRGRLVPAPLGSPAAPSARTESSPRRPPQASSHPASIKHSHNLYVHQMVQFYRADINF